MSKQSTLRIEAANRSEVTALAIRQGWKVYLPLWDEGGEDMILQSPNKKIIYPTQLKGRPHIEPKKYKDLWMLFPSKGNPGQRNWYLIRHQELYRYWQKKHNKTESWRQGKYTKKVLPDGEIAHIEKLSDAVFRSRVTL